MPREKKTEYFYYDDKAIALYQRPNSTLWQTRIVKEDGKAFVRSTGERNFDKALAWARKEKMRAEVLTEQGLDPNTKSFKSVAELWLAAIGRDPSNKPRKISDYTKIVKRYHIPYFGKHKITQITQKTLGEYEIWRAAFWQTGPGAEQREETIRKRDGTSYTREKTVTSKGKGDAEDTVLRQIFKFAVSNDYLDGSRMPIIGQKTTRGDKGAVNRRPAFTKEQAKAILDYCNSFPDDPSEKLTNERMVFSAFIHLVLGTGLRPGKEHQPIKWKHFSVKVVGGVEHAYLTIVKNTKTGTRQVRCDSFVWPMLSGFRYVSKFNGEDDFVLANQETGEAVVSFKRQFNTMLKALRLETDVHGDNFVPYSLRHTYATLKLNEGVSDRLVGINMGTGPDMIHRYYGHDTSVSRANEFNTDIDWLTLDGEKLKKVKRQRDPKKKP
jgi:integrase